MRAPPGIYTIDDIDFLHTIEAARDGLIDFGPVQFIKPVGVVALLATMERLSKLSGTNSMKFSLPENPAVRQYLRMAGVFDAMRRLISFTNVQPEDVIPKRSPGRPMVPCKYFESEGDVEQLANQMEENFQSIMPGNGSLLETCHTAFSELATNVVNHAESEGGYVLAQQYHYQSGRIVEIAVADCGIGIQESLQKNRKYTNILSDEDAIELAIKEGVSSLEDGYRGYGLYHVTYDVRRSNDRRLTIRSGYGTMVLQGNGSITKRRNSTNYPGTILNVTIPC